LQLLKFLISSGAVVHVLDKSKQNLLDIALQFRRTDIVRYWKIDK
jgi:hypothetical protein